MEMNLLDIIIVVAVIISVLIGLLRGFVRECFALASYIAGYLVATATHPLLAERIHGIISDPVTARIASFAVIFLVTVILTHLLGRLARRLIYKARGLSMIDRLIGLCFGFCRGVLILALVMIPLSLFPVIGSDAIKGSTLAPYLLAVSRELSTRAFSDENFLGTLKDKLDIDAIQDTLESGVDSLSGAAKEAKDKVVTKIGGKIIDAYKGEEGEKGGKGTRITSKDRAELNRLLEKF